MEFDVVNQIKKYWNKFIGSSDADHKEEFTDATSGNSVRACLKIRYSMTDRLF